MKGHSQVKTRGPSRVNTQQVIFELKRKVIVALNKLADRDTCQIAADELTKTAECLTAEGIGPFLSCILDTDSEQKSAVRKECVRLMGTLATFHEGLICPHLAKMVTSIVKRLKDQDSVVRDACVETTGILALKLGNSGNESDEAFVALVKPLFEALGEQNKQVQLGSALCLAKVIDNIHYPPVSILQRMLTRTVKLLKNQHFMAKPAVIELNRSIIQAGGAPTKNILSTAMSSIQEALKNSDWSTRKAASAALGELATSGGALLGSYKASCIRSLDTCRFDKVKPVRDTALHALQYWRSLPGSDTPDPSEAGSSIRGDYIDVTSTGESCWKDSTLKKVTSDSAKRRIPLSVRKTCQNYNEDPQRSRWQQEVHIEDSEGSSVSKTVGRMSADVTSVQDMGYEYAQIDDKQECSSVSNLVSESFETKFVTVSHENSLQKSSAQKFTAAESCGEEQIYSARMQDRRSLDSTVTDSCSQAAHGSYFQMSSEMVCIRKQLSEIENKQSNLMDLLEVFSTGIMDSLSTLQSKVLGLEIAVDRIAQDLVHGVKYSDSVSSKLMKQNQGASSPRLSTCTPRPSIDIRNRQPSMFSGKNADIWEENASKSRSSNSTKQSAESWTNTMTKNSRNCTAIDIQKNSNRGAQSMAQFKKNNTVFASVSNANARQTSSEIKYSLWQRVKDFLCKGDMESAYVEAISSGDELVLMELLNRTGPVLDSLSHKTVSSILNLFASYFQEQRFLNSIIPWLDQVVYLGTIRGPNHLVVPAKVRLELLSAIQEAVKMEHYNPAERKSITQLAVELYRLWGECN
ncbi:TORTIFOLIA1-like protein 2 isoform X1 [Tripterygium wilfordii]|uniref:TORTIFOLIA1-like protein 2 isoform X1 n=1 Tax=Tripterygium wilfordii TaxID=458696 RepID=UPI0018F82F59|nr:TORTIFOLIA1-like protein 2 isoform X1 [Tripterygium wilfordii]XP_038698489.1 TORTIFOLIA1-like protein 2 isoform X1 [Tripterygium wilfordii]